MRFASHVLAHWRALPSPHATAELRDCDTYTLSLLHPPTRRRHVYSLCLPLESLPYFSPLLNIFNMVAAPQANGDVRNRAGIKSYSNHWHADSAQDTAEHQKSRLGKYTDIANAYYDGATEIYEYGWGEKFHFCRFYKGEGFYQALARHEHYLAHKTGIKAGMRVLDVGCGIGGPAREIARFTDANVVGVNNNQFQIDRGTKYTKKEGLSERVSFVKGDFMKLSEIFGENSFDAVYAIEATVYGPTFEGIYGEIFKVLKPGGTFGVYEWCMTDAYDASIPRHREIAHNIEIGDGIAEMRKIEDARKALKTVGFQIEHEEDLADRGDELEWYYPLEGNLRKCQTLWDVYIVAGTTRLGIFASQTLIWTAERLRLAPKGTLDVHRALVRAIDGLVPGGRSKLFTPMMMFVSRKPKSS